MEYLGFNYNGGIASAKIKPLGQLYMKDYFEQIRIVVYPEKEHAEKRMYIAAPATSLEEANNILKYED
ncbi:hypothetical protein P4H39_00095 [Paenibacillus lautus]|uniref:hypothetical protein n=1 Tax=Paenibacillus lautus TaxID=1401 RepID=UPI002DBD3D08|nr:hypothetical protein [Paenibacillus lautus]MEC0201021.1 hypothetical protein [Paenibacillus lautus]